MTWIVEDYKTGNTIAFNDELDAAWVLTKIQDLMPEDRHRFGYYREE